MNKRMRNKKAKKNYDFIFRTIEQEFSLQSLRFGDSYCLDYHGENGICHFKIREIKGWLFGIWVTPENTFDFFCEHNFFVDKFKPSRGYFSENIQTIEDVTEKVLPFLRDLAKNPYTHFAQSYEYGSFDSYKEKPLSNEASLTVWNEYLENEKKKRLQRMEQYHQLFSYVATLQQHELIEGVTVIDRRTGDPEPILFERYPYRILIFLNEDLQDQHKNIYQSWIDTVSTFDIAYAKVFPSSKRTV